MTSFQITLAAIHLFLVVYGISRTVFFAFVFFKQEIFSEGTIKKSSNAVLDCKKKVATMRGFLYKIQHKLCWTSQLACNVCQRKIKKTLFSLELDPAKNKKVQLSYMNGWRAIHVIIM